MAVYKIDPLTYPRWDRFLQRHPQTSIFHTTGWLRALQNTYQYTPIAYTTSPEREELENAIPFCLINSWITGKRLVSLPFSDHAQPLTDSEDTISRLMDEIQQHGKEQGIRYSELRPIQPFPEEFASVSSLGTSSSYFLHVLNLENDLETIFKGFHKNCTQRSIRKTEREGIKTFSGRSPELLSMFYSLMVSTRRRHRLPPQPLEWFQKIVDCLGDAVTIRVACKDDIPIASLMSLHFKNTVVYKYGCSDERYFNLGGIFALFWEMIQEAKQKGATLLDLGRSDKDNPGLLQFKDRWGAERMEIQYYKSPAPLSSKISEGQDNWKMLLAKQVFSRLPDPLLIFLGRALYRHTG